MWMDGIRRLGIGCARRGLETGNDEKTAANGDGIFEQRDDEIGDAERLHQAGAPLIARVGSGNGNGSAGESPADDAGDQSNRLRAAGRFGEPIRDELDDGKHREDGDGGSGPHESQGGAGKIEPVAVRGPGGNGGGGKGAHAGNDADSESEKENVRDAHGERDVTLLAVRCQEVRKSRRRNRNYFFTKVERSGVAETP